MNFKRIIAKEGVILLVLSAVIYFSFTFLFRNIPVVYPKYSLKFSNGSTYIIDIYPDIDYSKVRNARSFLKEVNNPDPRLVSKRIGEFSKTAKVDSELKSAVCINKVQLCFSGLVSSVLSRNLPVIILAVYIFLLILRFLIWVVKFLKAK
ncbi:MAG: hypothetical protein WC394_04315 [Candidatus Omnitrophota bacterium]|jgi:hypothetical protein